MAKKIIELIKESHFDGRIWYMITVDQSAKKAFRGSAIQDNDAIEKEAREWYERLVLLEGEDMKSEVLSSKELPST